MSKFDISLLTSLLISDLEAEPNIKPCIVLYGNQIFVEKDHTSAHPAPDVTYKILVNQNEVETYYNKFIKSASKENLCIELANSIIGNLI